MNYAEKIKALSFSELPAEVQRQAKICLKDVLATAAGASTLPNSAKITELAKSQYGTGNCPIWFRNTKTSFIGASLSNAFMTDSLDCHDGFRLTKGHVGATIIPVLLSCCCGRNVSGADLLAAVVIGYEIGSRAGIAIHKHYSPAYHASGSWAALGAAAAAAKVAKLDIEKIDDLLGIAEYYAPMSPMMRCIDKPCSVKDSAAIGAFSAAMAFCMIEQNLTGLGSILTAEDCGRELVESFGSDWMIMRQYFKPYPVCRWAQPSVEAVLELKKKYSFAADDIEKIDIEIFDAGSRLIYFPPGDSDQAQYSLPWAVGCAIVDGKLGLAQVHHDRLKDKTILSLGRKVKTRVVDDIQKRFPAECLSRVNLHLKNGTILKSSTHQARGDYNNPLSAEDFENKAAELFGFVVDKKRYEKISDVIGHLENINADKLLELL